MSNFGQQPTGEKEQLIEKDKEILQNQLGFQEPNYIGTGSFSRVYRVKDTDGTFLAIKVQNQEEYSDQEFAVAGSLVTIPSSYFIKTQAK
ncbi:MAG: hypothetical protein EZS28_054622 [Streblomastix strix]|uniref:Protein kinase domain-containing protein n=1 Tax=Streblomastix strix TaxID=222440 RepID=A0A5J4QK43_9EUKA|nr:MAG: hypothetical protein EZS28_054622 [Streblomastix strix]